MTSVTQRPLSAALQGKAEALHRIVRGGASDESLIEALDTLELGGENRARVAADPPTDERPQPRGPLQAAGSAIASGFAASWGRIAAPFRRQEFRRAESAIASATVGKRGLRIGDGDAPERIRADHLRGFIDEAKDAFDALPGSGTRILDRGSGAYRSVSPRDMAAARRLVAVAERILPEVELNASPYPSSLAELLNDPKVAQLILSELGAAFSPRLYLQGLEILREVAGLEPSAREKTDANRARLGARRFRKDTLKRVGTLGTVIDLCCPSKTTRTLRGTGVTDLVLATRPLVDGLVGVDLKIRDEVTGFPRQIQPEDLDTARRVLDQVTGALKDKELNVSDGLSNLPALLSHPDVAACVLEHARPERRTQFQRDYAVAVDVLRGIDTAYNTRMVWGCADDPERGLTIVASRKHAPREVLDALEDLTYGYFDGITHLWFTRLMREDPTASREYETLLRDTLDAHGQTLLDVLIEYRDSDSIRALAVRDGKRDSSREVALHQRFAALGRETGLRTVNTDYYNGISDGMAKQVLLVVGVGTLIGKGLDYGTGALGLSSLELWKPTILGGWDDVLGTFPNIKEMLDIADRFKDSETRRLRRRGALVDGAIAAGVGISTSAALTLPLWFLGGQSFASLMLGPGADPVSKAASWAVYGAASSGGTATLSILPGLRNRDAVRKMLEDGIVTPTFRGKPLKGSAKEAWVLYHALGAHLRFTAQLGGALGVGASAVFMAGASVLATGADGAFNPFWAAMTVNMLLAFGGAFETITTGVTLAARRSIEHRQLRRLLDAGLAKGLAC